MVEGFGFIITPHWKEVSTIDSVVPSTREEADSPSSRHPARRGGIAREESRPGGQFLDLGATRFLHLHPRADPETVRTRSAQPDHDHRRIHKGIVAKGEERIPVIVVKKHIPVPVAIKIRDDQATSILRPPQPDR